MANQTAGLFETRVLPAAAAAVKHLEYSKAFAESIYWNFDSNGSRGQTSNLNIPKVTDADATDIAGGAIAPSDTDHDTVPIVINQHPSVSFTVQSWDKVRTPVDLQNLYLQPKLESLLRKINKTIADLAVTGNFNSYTAITGGTDTFTRANLTKAWANLTGAGVPTMDAGNLSFISNPGVYANMMGDENFFKESIVGKDVAELIQRKAVFAPTLNAVIKFDQQSPIVATKSTGLFFHRHAIGGVCVRPPALSLGGDGIKEAIIYPFRNKAGNANEFPVQIQMQASVNAQGAVIHMHAMFGLAVCRKQYGQYLVAV